MYGCDCGNSGGLGQFDPATAMAAVSIFERAWSKLEDFFRIGGGRKDADLIVPVQNEVGDRLIEINNAINRSNVGQLQAYHSEVGEIGREFTRFVNDPVLVSDGDDRASRQALDTIMPLVDGTDSDGNQVRADRGTLGSIERRIIALGGALPPPVISQGYGSAMPTLRYPMQSYPWIPQAGTLPPNAPLSPISPQSVASLQAGFTNLLPFLLIGGLVYTASRR